MKKKHIIITAAGGNERWIKSGGKGLKQMVMIDGEPLIHRTLRQVADHKVFLVTQADKADVLLSGAPYQPEVIDPADAKWWCSSFLASARRWGRHNVCLLADVWFSDWAMERLLEADGLHLLGRREPSPITFGNGETFAWTWHKRDNPRLVNACRKAIQHAEDYPKERMVRPGFDAHDCPLATPWQPYRILVGEDPEKHCTDQKIWLEHSDFTDDFDAMESYTTWNERYAKRIICQKPLERIGDGKLSNWVMGAKDDEPSNEDTV
jgi:hypothetical protein